ncbi:signal recognition particle-docking protein FtsY [Actinomadura macrotermitis]|uniref:Signal recognition particle receptor FtsY n=1 Tax=Actinomadura macrotermitis TaxID=2585200 RepID=A0A7K0BPH0_9ACTN|nr:signal recognition particle-docking protein FtsY [Actinomadura macrotermitis]MQY03053.1 Signal recognition particle receptor FtsY [Actinomadura macrotermitis]
MEYVILIAGLAALAVIVGGVLFLRPSRRKPRPPVEPSERPADILPGGATTLPEEERTAPPAERAPPAGTVPARPSVEIEKPPPGAGRLVRLRARLARSQSGFGRTLLGLLSRDVLDDEAWEEIEDTLIGADIGVSVARQVTDDLRTRVQVLGTRSPEEVRAMLKEELVKQLGPDFDRSLHASPHGTRPAVLMVVGVNGTGKTTTCGKLARVLVGDGRTVLLGAADTFRAAAADQLETWGSRVGAPVVRKGEGADPASVAFDAVKQGIDGKVDTVIVDTAGRLHNKAGLMDELGKVKRVIEKQSQIDEVLLVLDATTGQNGLQQARVFAEVVNVTGVVLTKLDGTAKGGIVVQVQRELGVPVKLVGLGEGPDDLAPFEPEAFVDAILGD